jgi:hypothetical protein
MEGNIVHGVMMLVTVPARSPSLLLSIASHHISLSDYIALAVNCWILSLQQSLRGCYSNEGNFFNFESKQFFYFTASSPRHTFFSNFESKQFMSYLNGYNKIILVNYNL